MYAFSHAHQHALSYAPLLFSVAGLMHALTAWCFIGVNMMKSVRTYRAFVVPPSWNLPLVNQTPSSMVGPICFHPLCGAAHAHPVYWNTCFFKEFVFTAWYHSHLHDYCLTVCPLLTTASIRPVGHHQLCLHSIEWRTNVCPYIVVTKSGIKDVNGGRPRASTQGSRKRAPVNSYNNAENQHHQNHQKQQQQQQRQNLKRPRNGDYQQE